MRLLSADLLRAVVGPEPEKKISARRLALAIDKTPGFIDHLLAGRRKSCKPATAQRIAHVLGVPVTFLFEEEKPTTKQGAANSKRPAVKATNKLVTANPKGAKEPAA